jgi:hypothetical protein
MHCTIPCVVLLALSSCTERRVQASPSVATPASSSSPAIVPAPVAVPKLRASECLRSERGLPLMAQITKEGVTAGDETLPLFAPFYYVFAREPEQGEAKSYTIGRTKYRDSICAKVPADAVALWSTTVGACPLGPCSVYASIDDLRKFAGGDGSAQPIAVTPPGSQRRPFLWPIARTATFVAGGVEHEAWQIHFIGRAAAAVEPAAAPTGPTRYTEAEVAAFHQSLRSLDVVLVLDATGSMRPFWKAVHQQVAGLTYRLDQRRKEGAPEARFGLVAYRDHDKSSEFVTRSVSFGDEQALANALGSIRVDHGGDAPEAALDAVHAALAMPWRDSALAARVLVLVSDASFHEGDGAGNPNRLRSEQIASLARERRVHVFGLAVGQQERDADRARQLAQYEALATATGGATFAIEQADAAADRIESLLSAVAQKGRDRSAVLDAVAKGGTSAADISKSTNLPAEDVVEILDFLGGAIDLSRLRPGQPAFATGWVLPQWKGEPQLEMRVLVSRGDCELLRDACRRLIADLTGSPTVGRGLAGIGGFSRSGEGPAFDPDADIANLLTAWRGLPFRKDSVLRLSLNELDHMSEEQRRRRLDQVALALRDLVAFERDDRNFFTVHGTTYGFCAEAVLP